MLAFKQSRQHHFDTTLYNIDDSQAELDMNHYGSFDQSAGYASLPYPYYENPTLFVEAPLEDTKYDLSRSLSSTGSLHQHSQSSNEHTLSLISSASGPSLPSASSSTVGSPHSGHSHPISSADSWTSAINFNAHPAIANSEGFVGDYSVVDFGHEHAFGTATKLQDDFVGKCVDLSSFPTRSSTFSVNCSSSNLSFVQRPPFSASPEPVSVESFERFPEAAPSRAVRDNTSVRTSHQHVGQTFKQPTTPASARSRTPSTSSVIRAPTSGLTVPAQSPCRSYPTPLSPALSPSQHVPNQFQSHFFAQSSGIFMPPLESSCSFLSPVCCIYYFLFKYLKIVESKC